LVIILQAISESGIISSGNVLLSKINGGIGSNEKVENIVVRDVLVSTKRHDDGLLN
jgi:hypothetical protein